MPYVSAKKKGGIKIQNRSGFYSLVPRREGTKWGVLLTWSCLRALKNKNPLTPKGCCIIPAKFGQVGRFESKKKALRGN